MSESFGTPLTTPLTAGQCYRLTGSFTTSACLSALGEYEVLLNDTCSESGATSVGFVDSGAGVGSWSPGSLVFTAPHSASHLILRPTSGSSYIGADALVLEAVGTRSNYCVGAPNSTGAGARTSAAGSTSVVANNLVLTVDAAPPSQFGLFYFGREPAQIPLGDGFRCIATPFARLQIVQTNGAGTATFALDLTSLPAGSSVVSGETILFQFWYRDPGFGQFGFNLSDGLEVTFCP